jgi:hypothetical protein
VLTELAHEQRHRVGHASEVGLESQLRLGLPLRVDSVRIATDVVCVSDDGRDLDPARLELAAEKRELVVVEIELDRLRLELDRVDDAAVLGLVDEALQLVRDKRRVDLILLPSSGPARSRRRSKRSIRLPLPTGRSTPVYAGLHFAHTSSTSSSRTERVVNSFPHALQRTWVGTRSGWFPFIRCLLSWIQLQVRGDAFTSGSTARYASLPRASG